MVELEKIFLFHLIIKYFKALIKTKIFKEHPINSRTKQIDIQVHKIVYS